MALYFIKCINCGKTMPKYISGIELLDSMEPEKVWCSEFCLQEWKEEQAIKDTENSARTLNG